MKTLILAVLLALPLALPAKTLYQCATNKVSPNGVRINVIESNGKTRANLIFGTTVSGTMYSVEEGSRGYSGEIKNKPQFSLDLEISDTPARNANISGYRAYLKAIYPTMQNANGYDLVDTELVCGKKISDRWN